MSFLDGIMDAGKSVTGFLGGSSVASSLVKIAGIALVVSQMNKNNKSNDVPSSILQNPEANIDGGIRAPQPPDSTTKIPVLYGAAFTGGKITDAVMSNNNKTMHYCLVISEKTGTLLSTGGSTSYVFKDVYWNDQRVIFFTDGVTVNYTVDRSGNIDRSLSGLVRIWQYKGNSSSGQVPENYAGSIPPAYSIMPGWTQTTHPMSDLLFAIVEVNYNREKNVTGLGTLMFHVESNLSQPGDVLYDYMTNSRYGAGIAAAEILTA